MESRGKIAGRTLVPLHCGKRDAPMLSPKSGIRSIAVRESAVAKSSDARATSDVINDDERRV